LLDQIVADPNEHISFELAQAMLGAAGNEYVWEVVQAIINGDTAYGLDMINTAIDTGADPRQFGLQLIEHLRYLLLIRMGSEHLVNTSNDMRQALAEQAQYINHSTLLKAIRAFNTAFNDMRGGWQPQLPLELALVESTKPVDDEAPSSAPQQTKKVGPPRPKVRDEVPQAQNPPEITPQKAAQSAPMVSITDVHDRWGDLMKATNRGVAAILHEWCLPLRIENQILVVGVRSEGGALKSVLEEAKKIEVLKKAVQQVFGEVMGVRLELVDEDSLNNTTSSEDHEITNHELLSYAANEFGAEISFQDNDKLD
jgi:DNA polymerase-3 subunit gamma/tau